MTTYAITTADARHLLTPAQYAAIADGAEHDLTRADVERTWTAYASDEAATEALAAAGGGWVIDEDGATTWIAPDVTDVTDQQIRALRAEAAEAGDHAQVHLCELALGMDLGESWWIWHDRDTDRWSADMETAEGRCAAWVGGASDDGPAHMSQDAARAECARVIADAQAQQD